MFKILIILKMFSLAKKTPNLLPSNAENRIYVSVLVLKLLASKSVYIFMPHPVFRWRSLAFSHVLAIKF